MNRPIAFIMTIFALACQADKKKQDKSIRLITLDPGHFHAALVQKSMYENVDSAVRVYAPEGIDLRLHLDRINFYNERSDSPTRWKEIVYARNDFFEKMLTENTAAETDRNDAKYVVVLAGNNQKKTDYILRSLQNGFHVLADKPMAIDKKGFDLLKEAFDHAARHNLLLYDIMTERFEITTMLQRELSMLQEIFGVLEKGTTDNPAITKESVHHFYKHVSGKVLTRPAWFLDEFQQGEGIVDVMTHLVDLVQWECFPEMAIDYTKDISVHNARRWTTGMSLQEFKAITRMDSFPGYLQKNKANDTLLKLLCNGEINFTIKDIHAKTSVVWKYAAPDGSGDTHYSTMRGAKANLVIRQGAEEHFQPALYIEPVNPNAGYETGLNETFKSIQRKYPGVELEKSKQGWLVIIPQEYKKGHEAHFGQVMENFLWYLVGKDMPAWEVPNMLAKYYTTTMALELGKQESQ